MQSWYLSNKTMRKFLSIFLFVAAGFLSCASSCDKEKPGDATKTVTVSPTSLSVPPEGATETLSVTADCDWGITADNKSWCVVTPSGGGAGTSSVTVEVAKNSSYEARNTNVVIRFGAETITVPVEQGFTDLEITAPEGYSLVWAEEFTDAEISKTNWKFENWAPGHVNNELQRYVAGGVLDGKRTAFLENGVLHIRAMKHNDQVISARMNSTESWLYGYVEARIQLPKGKGTWPAFWMMPDDFSLGWPACGEIDILEEVGVKPNYTSSSIHTKRYNHVLNTQKTKEIYTEGAEDEFHVYAVEWTPDYLQFFTDGTPQMRFVNDGTGNNDTWPFNKKFYVILNLAWGGDWGGWNGVDESALPCTLLVDYVRVFQKK